MHGVEVALIIIVAIAAIFFVFRLTASMEAERKRLDSNFRHAVIAKLVDGDGMPRDLVEKKVASFNNAYSLRQWQVDGCWMTDGDGYAWAYGQKTKFPQIKAANR